MTLDDDELLLVLDAVTHMQKQLAESSALLGGYEALACARADMRSRKLIAKLEREREDRENGDA